jgi:hypothetical protein
MYAHRKYGIVRAVAKRTLLGHKLSVLKETQFVMLYTGKDHEFTITGTFHQRLIFDPNEMSFHLQIWPLGGIRIGAYAVVAA